VHLIGRLLEPLVVLHLVHVRAVEGLGYDSHLICYNANLGPFSDPLDGIQIKKCTSINNWVKFGSTCSYMFSK